MNILMNITAAELADALENMDSFPHNTGGLSMLDEATLAFGWKHPGTSAAQRAFSAARHVHKESYRTATGSYSDEAWAKAITAARALAAALRPLGDTRIARCQRPTGWGTCNFPLAGDGTCRGHDHIDTEAGNQP